MFGRVKEKLHKHKKKKYRMSSAGRLFFVLTMIFFIVLLIDTAVCLSVSKKSMYRFSYSYVSDKEIPLEYAEFYIQKGFTEKQYLSFFEGEPMRSTVANVLSDRLSVIFRYSEKFEHKEEDIRASIRDIVRKFTEDNRITVSESDIGQLTNYTMDISGLSSMFRYSTPKEYKRSLFSSENYKDNDGILYAIYSITRPVVVVVLYVMTFILSLITALFIWKDPGKEYTIGNIFLYPSIVILGFSIGEVFGNINAGVITRYFFRYLLWVSAAGIIYGVFTMVITMVISKAVQRKGV